MGFNPTGYEEIFMNSRATSDGSRKIDMVCIYPDQDNPARYVEGKDLVLSKSEMVVRYLNDKFWRGE
jgi:hypothetical protein